MERVDGLCINICYTVQYVHRMVDNRQARNLQQSGVDCAAEGGGSCSGQGQFCSKVKWIVQQNAVDFASACSGLQQSGVDSAEDLGWIVQLTQAESVAQ